MASKSIQGSQELAKKLDQEEMNWDLQLKKQQKGRVGTKHGVDMKQENQFERINIEESVKH